MFLGGLAVVVLATESGIGAYDDVLVWDHMIQHLMLIMVAPAMLVVGQPVTLLLHASRNPLHTWAKRAVRSRVVTWLTWPPVGVIAYAVTIIGTHLTRLMSLVMTNPALHAAEHALYLVVGYLFFLPLLGREPIRWRISYPVRLLVLFLTMPVDTFTGLALGYSTTPMAGMGPRPAWAPSALSDLHSAGAVMWVGGDGIMFALMMVVFLAWSRDGQISVGGHGWLESARRASFAGLTGSRRGARDRRHRRRPGHSVQRPPSTTTSTWPRTTRTWPASTRRNRAGTTPKPRNNAPAGYRRSPGLPQRAGCSACPAPSGHESPDRRGQRDRARTAGT